MPPREVPWHQVDISSALAEIEYLAHELARTTIPSESILGAGIDPVWAVRYTLSTLRTLHARTKEHT